MEMKVIKSKVRHPSVCIYIPHFQTLNYSIIMHMRRIASASVSNGSGLPSCGPCLEPDWMVQFGDGLEPHRCSILRFLQLWIQLSIGVLIVLQHDIYVKFADRCPISSPALRFAIGSIFIESHWNSAENHAKMTGFSLRLNDYWSNCKSENGR